MINLIKLNIFSFARKKSFNNYIIINVIILFIMFLLLGVKQYCKSQIDNIVNDGNNKIININSFQAIKDVKTFFEENNETITNIKFDIINYTISDNNTDYIVNNLEYNDNKSEFFVTSNTDCTIDKIKIGNKKIDVQKSSVVPLEIIYVNQYTASYMCMNIKSIKCSISFELKNYFDADKVFSKMLKHDISGNLNEEISDTIITYKNINSIMTILFLIMITSIIIITIVLAINFLYEERKNILIFNNIGYTIQQITIMYISMFLYFLNIAYFISLIIIPIISIILFFLGEKIIKDYLLTILLPLLILMVINILTITIELYLIIKNKKNQIY